MKNCVASTADMIPVRKLRNLDDCFLNKTLNQEDHGKKFWSLWVHLTTVCTVKLFFPQFTSLDL